MRLIPGVLVSPSVINAIDSNGDGMFSDNEEHAYAQRVLDDCILTIDGQRLPLRLVSWTVPQPAQLRDGLGEIHIEYTADLPKGGANRSLILVNHPLDRTSVYLMNVLVPAENDLRILAQKRNAQQSVYEVDFQQSGKDTASPSMWPGIRARLAGFQFSSLFHLGMRHIAEGTDHLLFLLTLLLPAPLLPGRLRWGPPDRVRQSLLRILGIVTAFTLGHSITLTLAALGVVHVADRLVEVLVAASILVSALHALRPIVSGKEAWIATFFGLIHGLAFAATLDRLGLGRLERLVGILAFNLGIETMQAVVVLAILPSLLLLSRTRVYPAFRTTGALFAGAAALAWIAERGYNIRTFVDPIVDALARHGLLLAVLLFLASLACTALAGIPSDALAHAAPSSAVLPERQASPAVSSTDQGQPQRSSTALPNT